ncbi:MAG: dipeptidase [Bacteroidetes bacterium]|nr:dipeptidase [Bacteroidota bacterium]MBU1113774.1 dipeptidase [Bacteroidota bacterium]MBU1800357.1 dipeptidase [Bacteroidota bacterium]
MKILGVASIIIFLLSSCKNKSGQEMHSAFLTIDSHIDIPIKLTNDSTYNLEEDNSLLADGSRTDFPRMDKGGLDAAFFIVWTAQHECDSIGIQRANDKAHEIIATIKSRINSSPSFAQLAFSSDDIIKINDSKRHPILIGMENGYPIGKDISQVEHFYNLGIRYLTLCHTKNNDICCSSTDESEDKGLTNFGIEVVHELNRLGIIIDVSHISDSAFYQVIKYSKAPVVATHSNCRALCSHPRNMTDDMIKLLAKNGGIIDINFVDEYLRTPEPNAARDSAVSIIKNKYSNPKISDKEKDELSMEWDAIHTKFPSKHATISDVIDHIDYVVKLVGIDYVGIGSDFDGGGRVAGLNDVSEMGNLTNELLKRGYSEKDIEKIWSGNFMRVFREVENISHEIKN